MKDISIWNNFKNLLPINWFFSSSWNSIWTANNDNDNNNNSNNANKSNKNKNSNNYNRITTATTNTKSIAATNSSTNFISKSFLEQTKEDMERAWYFWARVKFELTFFSSTRAWASQKTNMIQHQGLFWACRGSSMALSLDSSWKFRQTTYINFGFI